MKELTAAELELEALLESRLEILGARLKVFNEATLALLAETQALHTSVQAKARRMYIIEDNLLRIQGKPGLPHLFTENGSQRRPTAGGIGNNEIEDIKMGVKTLRRKFQAAGAVVSTVGWWRHLKDKEKTTAVQAVPGLPSSTTTATTVTATLTTDTPAKLSIDTSSSVFTQDPLSPPTSTSPDQTTATAAPARRSILSPKAILSPTSSSTKKRNTTALQDIFTSAPTNKPLHQHYILSPSSERANPALGLNSPPLSPRTTENPSLASGNSLMRSFSLRS
ncbi:hypothetical protein FBU30_000198 [Linnemannia zychae]|nr:hypothetical protein FBU30_000198 [Linnemannia zychae]